MPRRVRMTGGLALASLQVLILLTGNYTFFNWLTLGLCLLVLDDSVLRKLLHRFRSLDPGAEPRLVPQTNSRWRWMLACMAVVWIGISLVQLAAPLGRPPRWTAPVVGLYQWLAPFRTINSYGLFAVMTKSRPEIIVEGSENGRDWKAYEFRYQPGNLSRRPPFVAPYQPRLDWQMWFAALGDYRDNPWFVNFCLRLLEGAPEVLALLATNPFPAGPPKYIRAELYDYRFTTLEERRRTGAWWKREFKGEYLPAIGKR